VRQILPARPCADRPTRACAPVTLLGRERRRCQRRVAAGRRATDDHDESDDGKPGDGDEQEEHSQLSSVQDDVPNVLRGDSVSL